MPGKKKNNSVIVRVLFKCTVKIDPKTVKIFERDLKRGQLSCSASWENDGHTYSFSLYPDQVSGGIVFSKIDRLTYAVHADGEYILDDESGEWGEIKQNYPNAKLIMENVTDSDVNYYYIDGDETATCLLGSFAE